MSDLRWEIDWGEGPKGFEWCRWYKLRPITTRTIRPDEVPEWPEKGALEYKCIFAPVPYLTEINGRAALGLPQNPSADPKSDVYLRAIG